MVQTEERSAEPDQVIKDMPEMANLVYNMYIHMIQSTQQYRQVRSTLYLSGVFSLAVDHSWSFVLVSVQKRKVCNYFIAIICY